MTIRLLMPYGKYPKNTNITLHSDIETQLLQAGLADTNISLGDEYSLPSQIKHASPVSLTQDKGVYSVKADAQTFVMSGAAASTENYLQPRYYREEAITLYNTLVRQYCAVEWQASETVAVGACRVTTAFKNNNNTISMKIHRCTTAGVTGTTEPTWTTTSGATTSDGTAVWTAYPAYFFDADSGNDSTGDGSQATPWKTFAKLTVFGGSAVLRTGNGVFLKRGTTAVYGGTQPSVTRNQVISVQKDGGDSSSERRNIEAYGIGTPPVLDATGLQFGINFSTTNATNNCNATVRGLKIINVDTDTAVNNGVPAVGIYVPADASSRATNAKIFDTEVSDVNNSSAAASGTDDFDAIRITGTGTVVACCHLHDIDDDGLWLDGTDDTTVILNHIHDIAQSYASVARIAGDCLQISATAAANNVRIWANILDHSNAACKHGLLGNPASSSSGWDVRGNLIIGQKSAQQLVCYPVYLARMTGDFKGNIIYSQAASYASGGHILIAGGIRSENNLVICRNTGAGFNLNVSGDSGNPRADFATCLHNTVIGQGAPAAFGVTVASSVLSEHVANNAFINVTLPVNYGGAGFLGPFAAQNCGSTLVSGSPTRYGTNVIGPKLFNSDGKPSLGSAAIGTAEFIGLRYGPDAEPMANPATFGAYAPVETVLS